MNKRYTLSELFSMTAVSKQQAFIDLVVPGAQEVQKECGMFTSVTIAQAAWETGWGISTPKDIHTGDESYNLFGRKASIGDLYVESYTWEVYNGVKVYILARFKKFNSYVDSILDRSSFLKLPWYQRACLASTPEDAARFLIDTGYPGYSYATDPNYSDNLISIIHAYNLTRYDLEADYVIKQEDADQILAILGKYWEEMKDNKQIQDYTHYLANEVRKAAKIPVEE
jgi:flagellum-specific peptidoglycan hydrolase FlgJ